MQIKRRRAAEWVKSLLILLLAVSAVYLLSRTALGERARGALRALRADKSSSVSLTELGSAELHPVRLAVYRDGQRYGAQYDQEEVDQAFAPLSTLFQEALGSVGQARAVTERDWMSALCSTGIYLDFLYAIPLQVLSGQEGGEALDGAARRVCLAAKDGGVWLFYRNEEDGSYYACQTTLSRDFHLDTAVAGYSPNGALFAFEASGMEALDPYTMLLTTPEPPVYAAANPLLKGDASAAQLLRALGFHTSASGLDPASGGQVVEEGDSLRLSAAGTVSFHAIGGDQVRFPVPDGDLSGAVRAVQDLAESTAGAWCGSARLCLSQAEQTGDSLVVVFQYCLNGCPVDLPEDADAARFVVRGGAVTDFTLTLRTYAGTGRTSLVLPPALAAAVLDAKSARGSELALLYEDAGGDQVSAGWVAFSSLP